MTQKKRAPSGRLNAEDAVRVGDLARLIDGVLRDAIPPRVRVVGEVSGFRERTHWYFDLKDADAQIGCVVFASSARRISFRPENGNEVVVSGRVEFYAPTGKLTLVGTSIAQVGSGARDLEYKKLASELRAAGYFDPDRKRQIPLMPRCIGVITSKSGAALQDIRDTIRRRCPGVAIAVVDVRVQGEGAAREIARAIRMLSARHEQLGIDLVVVTRGGGSAEDLWAFNERNVADAIYDSDVPVLAAIGHETDTTIAELVADERAATPTQAAMRAVPDASALLHQVQTVHRRLQRDVARKLERARGELRGLARHVRSAAAADIRHRAAQAERAMTRLERVKPAHVYAKREAMLAHRVVRLRDAIETRLRTSDPGHQFDRLREAVAFKLYSATRDLAARESILRAVGPESVLARGFSWTRRTDGRLVRTTADIHAGQVVMTTVADGAFSSRVLPDPDRRTREATPPGTSEKPGGPQLDLFRADG